MTPSAPKRFRDSAVVVLLRGAGADLEVFWVRRSDAVAVMPGFEAFIGGSVDPSDAAIEMEGAADDTDRVMRACAVRETFEETGVLVALAAPVAAAPLEAARRRLLAGETSFAALASEHGWRFRASEIAFAGRWQTPPFANVRFDAMYFIARLPAGQSPSIRAGELASGEWIRPAEALESWRRGEATFAAPILYTLRALAEGGDDLVARVAQAPEQAGQPVRRIEMKWGIVLLPMKTRPLPPATHTNTYLVGEREMALVDPGSDDPEALAELWRLLDTLAAEGRRVRLVVLTHHHPDHVAGLDAVRARLGVPVAATADTARHVRADMVVKDGDWLPLVPGAGDWNLRVLHTPGHTRGHLSLLHPRTRSLLCGDHIPGGRGTVIIDPPEGDMAAYLDSLARLLREPIEFLFPGHGSPQGGARVRIEALIAHRLKREALVIGALEAAPRPLHQLVERAYVDTARELWPYAERSLLAHLIKLEHEGKAVREGEGWRRA